MLLRDIDQFLEKYSGVSLHMLWIGSINPLSKKLVQSISSEFREWIPFEIKKAKFRCHHVCVYI